jgi:hypothetical protein
MRGEVLCYKSGASCSSSICDLGVKFYPTNQLQLADCNAITHPLPLPSKGRVPLLYELALWLYQIVDFPDLPIQQNDEQ